MTTERQSQQSPPGPLRRILSSAFSIFETRLELIGIELQEEKDRLIAVLFLGLAAMMLSMMALITLTVLIAIFSGIRTAGSRSRELPSPMRWSRPFLRIARAQRPARCAEHVRRDALEFRKDRNTFR